MSFLRKHLRFRLLTWCLLFVFLSLIFFILGMGYYFSAPAYQGKISHHFTGERFINLQAEKPRQSFAFFRWISNRQKQSWRKEYLKPSIPVAFVDSDELKVTFVNHSTVLLQTQRLNILTDPIWSERCSPVSWAGPKRYHAPGIDFSALPVIHVVLMSHNHYDHFDLPTLKKLNDTFHPQFITGLGNKILLEKNGIKNVTELDWWEEIKIQENFFVNFVPAQHFSGRGLFDRNKTLWGGFVVRANAGNIYYSGDTGFHPPFEKIYQRYGAMRLALLPIGAYEPRWFMKPVHINPEEAVKAHQILNAQTSVAVHFGTFRLADEGQFTPIIDLFTALQKEKISPQDFWVLKPGEGRLVK